VEGETDRNNRLQRVKVGAGIVAGTLIGAAAASNAYYDDTAYACRYVGRYDRWGNLRTVKVCDVVPY